MVLRQLDIYMKKQDPHLTSRTKWITELNVRVKIIKLLEENRGVNLHELWLNTDFSIQHQSTSHRTCLASTLRVTGQIPGLRTKTSHTTQCSQRGEKKGTGHKRRLIIIKKVKRPETVKLLQKNIGRTLSHINHCKILQDPPSRVMEIKNKNKQMGPNQI